MFKFPFEVPADLGALSAADFATFAGTVRTFATELVAKEDAGPEALIATRELFSSVAAEETRRSELAASAKAARESLSAGLAPTEPTPEPVPVPDPQPTPPAPKPEGDPVVPAQQAGTIDPAPEAEAEVYAVLTASADAPGFQGELASFSDAGKLIEKRLGMYSKSTNKRPAADFASRNAGAHRVKIGGRSLQRHGTIAIQRQFPENLRIQDANDAMKVLDYASSEARLPGGSLIASMEKQIAAGKSLTAAVGWCAPSETIYELCALETMDGMLDIPQVQASRGGFFIPADGGPNFSVIYDSIGDDGDVILTEYDVENGAEKVCVEIPCPEFIEVRLDVAYVCITGSLLQRRGYPEAVTRFTQGAMVALAHKVNESVIQRIIALSGSPITITADPSGDDAASALLSAIELGIEDMKYRHRMGRGQTMEVVLPAWVMAPIRAALSRRQGVAMINVSDADILAAFTTRHAVPRFVYDWQDAYAGLNGGPGGQTPITAWPTTVQFLVYPAGTFVQGVQDVVSLDTVYDNAMLTQNQYTALFVEDGFSVMKMCVDSRLYTVPIDVSGVVGCCP